MKLIKVAAGVLNQTPRDWKGNLTNILDAIKQAQAQNASILCLPEMCITGYGLEDDYFCLDVGKRAILKLKEICSHTRNLIVNVGLPIVFNNTLYNATAIIVDEKVIGFRCKESLANDGIHYESRWFKPWPKGVSQIIDIPELEGKFPIGDIKWDDIREVESLEAFAEKMNKRVVEIGSKKPTHWVESHSIAVTDMQGKPSGMHFVISN